MPFKHEMNLKRSNIYTNQAKVPTNNPKEQKGDPFMTKTPFFFEFWGFSHNSTSNKSVD